MKPIDEFYDLAKALDHYVDSLHEQRKKHGVLGEATQGYDLQRHLIDKMEITGQRIVALWLTLDIEDRAEIMGRFRHLFGE